MLEKNIKNIETFYDVTVSVSRTETNDIRNLLCCLKMFVYDNKENYDQTYIDKLREDLQSLITFIDSIVLYKIGESNNV